MVDHDVKDTGLAAAGALRVEWAEKEMPVLALIRERFEKEKPLEGTVIAVGEGGRKESGDGFVKPVVKVGDRVLIGKYSGTEVKINEEDFVVVREDDILAVLEG